MLADTAVGLLAQRLGFRTDQNSNVLAAMQYVQQYVLQEGVIDPFFLREWATGLVTVGEQSYVTLPADFLREPYEWETGGLYLQNPNENAGQTQLISGMDGVNYYVNINNFDFYAPNSNLAWDGSWFRLTPMFKSSMVSYQDSNAGAPIYYEVDRGADKINLLPTPDRVYNLQFLYIKQDVAPTLGQENLWLKYAADWLMAETGVYFGTTLRLDRGVLQQFQQEAVRGMQRIEAMGDANIMNAGRRMAIGARR